MTSPFEIMHSAPAPDPAPDDAVKMEDSAEGRAPTCGGGGMTREQLADLRDALCLAGLYLERTHGPAAKANLRRAKELLLHARMMLGDLDLDDVRGAGGML